MVVNEWDLGGEALEISNVDSEKSSNKLLIERIINILR